MQGRGSVLCAALSAVYLTGESPRAEDLVLLFDILYTMGNNRGMKGQSAVNNRLSRIKIRPQNHTAFPGSGKFQVVGVTSKTIRETARMSFDYLRGNAKGIGLDRDFGSYDFNIQIMSPMAGKDTEDLRSPSSWRYYPQQ